MKRGGRRDVGVGRTKAPARQRCPTASSTPTVWVGSGGRGDWRGRGGGERERERVERSIFEEEEEDGGGRAFLNLCPRMPLVIPICNASNPLIARTARNFDEWPCNTARWA